MDAKNDAIELAKKTDTDYVTKVLPNGDTIKQLLPRSRYVLYKKEKVWTENQKQRAALLFELYPDIKQSYDLTMSLSYIFENTTDKLYGLTRLAKWHERVRQARFKAFNTVARSI
ncbi:hypothetical protein D0T08_02400 [Emticicia sp. C21]|nr:hypothetical protein D0T08_02400 [Emticicia sp. C21]